MTLTVIKPSGIESSGNYVVNSMGISANVSVGTHVTATGNITGGNIITAGAMSVTGNANVGNIGAAAGVFTANVSANNLSTTNKVTAGNGLQVTTGALTILSGNLDITGNLNVTGNVNYSNVTDLVVGDPLIYIGEDNSGDAVDLGIVASYNNGSYAHTGIARNAATDYWTFFDGVAAEPTTVIDWANATYPTVKMGALLSTSTVTGTQLISNIATGTAPLVVSSTTQVANLNAATAGLATYATTANAVAGANVSGAVSYATTANSVAGANVSGTVSSATTAGTVTTAAQPNITSVGTLTSLTLSGTLTGAVQIGTGTATHFGTTLTTGANSTAGTITGNWSLSAGSRLNATYADLAEKYVADAEYAPGTVLEFGGEQEVTISSELSTTRVAGVVTTNPAYTMNNECEGEHVATLALQGRVPCKVIGPIRKGDLLVSAGNGHAITNNEARAGTIIGKSLENFSDATGVIEVAVGRF